MDVVVLARMQFGRECSRRDVPDFRIFFSVAKRPQLNRDPLFTHARRGTGTSKVQLPQQGNRRIPIGSGWSISEAVIGAI